MILAVFDNLADLIQRGGWVMMPLLAMSVLSITLVLERSLFWWRLNGGSGRSAYERLIELLANNDRARIKQAAQSSNGVYNRIASAMIRQPDHANAIATVEHVRPRIERFMVTLSTIITAAPLLGILGTVFGIIQSFDLLGSQEALLDPRTVSAGIAEALLTTALGLVVALITLFPYMIFKGQVDRTLGRLEALIAAAMAAESATTQKLHTSREAAAETRGHEKRTKTGG